jgi:hypothetical protein
MHDLLIRFGAGNNRLPMMEMINIYISLFAGIKLLIGMFCNMACATDTISYSNKNILCHYKVRTLGVLRNLHVCPEKKTPNNFLTTYCPSVRPSSYKQDIIRLISIILSSGRSCILFLSLFIYYNFKNHFTLTSNSIFTRIFQGFGIFYTYSIRIMSRDILVV